ncbi:hypothetical protein MKW92_002889 [Papaver armeniacum]|nr:hypothetical protein MKW92_002889 [Papaver armeniacum]
MFTLSVRMNSTRKIRGADLETPFPGCMGRMINLFDFGPGMTGNKLLIDKEHQNAPRGRPEVIKKTLDPIGDQIEEKQTGCELKMSPSNTKYNGTPMKMLIAQEMSRENGCKQNPPSVVAKLMGLDTLPEWQPNSAAQRSQSNGYCRNAFSQPGTPNRYMQQDKYKDVYEVWQNSPKSCYGEDKLPQRGRHKESQDEKKMALVREKFIEAKRLSMNEKHRQSNEFQEALEFLSSNKDLFLKLLQEPNSSKRITVLKPSRTMENSGYVGFERKSEKLAKKQNQLDEANGWSKKNPGWSSPFTNHNTDHSAPPTRIVVLKPSPGKAHDIKAVVSSLPSSPRQHQSNDFYEELENDEARSSRKVALKITRQMRGSVDSQQKEETVNSSVFSNGYVGDDSSFDRSENEFIEEGNLSEIEVVTPTSRYSWDYGNRFGSPYSSSSFSRASLSPESSVCREAKKRLSERWAVRSSSTLGEMLALSDVNKSVRSGEVGLDGRQCVPTSKSCGGEQDLSYPLSSLAIFTGNIHGGEDSPKNLVRSRSLPVSSTVYGTTLVNEVSNPPVSKTSISNEAPKSKNGKSSFKEIKEKLNVSFGSGSDKEPQSAIAELPVVAKKSIPDIASDIIPPSVTNIGAEGFSVQSPRGSFCNNTSPASVIEPNQGIFSNEQVNLHFFTLFKSNLLSKSPPIGSLARSLSWDDSCSDVATTDPLNSCPPLSEAEEEQERFLFVQSLLSSTSLDWNDHSDNVFTRWHSPECPLDPSVLDKFFNQVEVKEQTYGAKCRNRKLRSNHKLLFRLLWTRVSSNSNKSLSTGESVIMEEVWSRVKEWFSNESKMLFKEIGDNNGLVVETVVRKEVVGRGWVELMRLEVDGIGNDIEGEVLEELVDEALFDLTGRLC